MIVLLIFDINVVFNKNMKWENLGISNDTIFACNAEAISSVVVILYLLKILFE